MVQNILFPEGIIYDKKNDSFRTSQVKVVIDLISQMSMSCNQKKERQENHADLLSPSVAPRLPVSNHFIQNLKNFDILMVR